MKSTQPSGGSSINVEVKTSDLLTIIHLLASHDMEVVIQALRTTHSQCISNSALTNQFCERGLWANLRKLLTVKNSDILTLSLDLVRTILTTTNFPLILMDESKEVFENLKSTYITNEDVNILIFCAEIMIKITELYPDIREFLADVKLTSKIFDVVSKKPSDELKIKSLTLAPILINNKLETEAIVALKNFQPDFLLQLSKGELDQLRNAAINYLIKISSFESDKTKGFLFTKKIPHELILMSLKDEFINLRFDALYISALILNNYANCAALVDTKEFPALLSFIRICTPEFAKRYAELLLNFSIYDDAIYRQKLHNYGFELIILLLFDYKNESVNKIVAKIMMNLANHFYGIETLITEKSVEQLIAMLGSSDIDGVLISIESVYCFMKKCGRMIDLFYDKSGFEALSKIFLGDSEIDDYSMDKVLTIMQMYLTHGIYKSELMDRAIFEKLMWFYENAQSEQLALKSVQILNEHAVDEMCQNIFLELDGCKILMEKVKSTENQELFKNTLIFIKTLVVYQRISKVFLMHGLIPLLKEHEGNYTCVKLIINNLISLFLPLKFFNNKILEVADIIKDNFYLIKGPWREPNFPFLEELEMQKRSTVITIYIIDYSYTKYMFTKPNEERENLSIYSFIENNDKKTVTPPVIPEINYGGLTEDPYLYNYFQEVTELFSQESYGLTEKIQIIANYVDKQMSGFLDMETKEPKHVFELHLNSLKHRLGTNMVPIGFLRMGYSCERALLFKVLADYFNVYVTLKVENGVYWNEVALLSDDDKCVEGKPGSIIGYVVDLFNKIGAIYPVHNLDALDYFDILSHESV